MKKNIMCVITNRASYAKLKSLLVNLKEKSNLQIVLAAGALVEKYGDLEIQIKKDGFRIVDKIFMLLDSQTLINNTKSTGIGILEFSNCFYRNNPSLVILMADRFEILSAAIAASYQNIKIAHIQGGENSGNIDQKVRYAVSALSDIHFPSTKKAYEILKRKELKKNIFLSGCPSIDLCKKIEKRKLEKLIKIFKNYKGVGQKVDLKKKYILIMYHPVTNEYISIKRQFEIFLNAIKSIEVNKIWFWPNPDSGSHFISNKIRKLREKNKLNNIFFIKNMSPDDFLLLLKYANCIVGNSSAGIRESSYLGTPSINVGSRQQNRETGKNVMNVDYNEKKIIKTIKLQLNKNYKKNTLYGHGNAGKKIAKTILNLKI